MFICVDTHYFPDKAVVAGIVFSDITSPESENKYVVEIKGVQKYQPRYFYKRELPGILKLLDHVQEPLQTIIIDGYVWLSRDGRPGLGAHLFSALDHKIPVIGVAKNPFRDASWAVRIFRGRSTKPLYITSAGMDIDQAPRLITDMHGQYRIPTLLKHVDALSRKGV